jgi:anthranilate phosphoribosyltransferase
VSSDDLLDLMAQSLRKLGVESALVVHSCDGTDEISIAGPTMAREVRNGQIRERELTPGDFGVPAARPDAMRGGDAETNAAILHSILDGEKGATRDAAVINAAAALYAAGCVDDLRTGAERAAEAIDSGAARTTLERLRTTSQQARAAIESAA